MAELLDGHDAVGLAELVRTDQVKPAELLDAVVARLEERNPVLNAVVSTRLDEAYRDVAAGLPEGPLRGVPFGVKDLECDVAGMASTYGSRLFADNVVDRDGVLASRYRAVGLVLVGKTNTPEFGKNASTEPLLFGPARNPWNTGYSTGGSSGGSAAAVAGGILPAGHANDGGGSIRIPAACCGLFGLKPSRGRVPHDGADGAFASPLSIANAVTRTVRDSAALLDAVAGPLPGDPSLVPAPAGSFLAALAEPPARLRIGFATVSADGVAAHPAAVAAVERTAALLAELGHDVSESAPSWDPAVVTNALRVLMGAATRARIEDRLAALGRDVAVDDLEPMQRFAYDALASVPAAVLTRTLRETELLGRHIAPWFAEFDVWLTPTLGIGVPQLGWMDTTRVETMGNAGQMTWFTSVFNATGLPAASVPAGFDGQGLPVGVQLVGRMGAEATLLRVAAQLEEAAPWPWQAPWPVAARD
ncbi:amidase [Yinghuangia seranimata]|uniref:amidase n=1 Tax=Yinghuangia seranimata TaxID=408067 RepID=UPI00248B3644|nr:amidase [Yinghuangia seranimata]MDI2131453.1 amidase [Yinghuangia seranimata]